MKLYPVIITERTNGLTFTTEAVIAAKSEDEALSFAKEDYCLLYPYTEKVTVEVVK